MGGGGLSENPRAHRVVVAQGDVVWASLPPPLGSEPGFPRPVVVVQGDELNASRVATVVVVPLTSNLRWAAAPGNVALPREATGLPKESVANVSQIGAVNRGVLHERVSRLDERRLTLVLDGIDVILGRESRRSTIRPGD